ncbi:hypothetical protein AZ905_09215 [Staphylococcus epidermidis]|uniref:hypothetical protein n=1 Tax=Staphylococcus epidermidis TaxID=1282 RepID=UPI000F89D104|nr:hypothetical protein [Staphylococcus epidermidis]RUN42079.1 hypothetical protein AZ905_09215 [Staphylococcus epidermidis]
MKINHAGTLSVNYFVGYLNLIMILREVSLKEAVSYMKNEFFKGKTDLYGKVTETHFNQAIQELKQK